MTKPPRDDRVGAAFLQLHGLDVDKNAIQRIEAGKRFVQILSLFISLMY